MFTDIGDVVPKGFEEPAQLYKVGGGNLRPRISLAGSLVRKVVACAI